MTFIKDVVTVTARHPWPAQPHATRILNLLKFTSPNCLHRCHACGLWFFEFMCGGSPMPCCTSRPPSRLLLLLHYDSWLQDATRHTSHDTRQTSHVTRHSSLVTSMDMSHVITRHPSHVTRHMSHVTRQTSHVTHQAATTTTDDNGGDVASHFETFLRARLSQSVTFY